MAQIEHWFRAKKSLRRKRVYYEDIHGYKNPEEEIEGVDILASESDFEVEITSPKRRVRNKTGNTLRNDINTVDNDQTMESNNGHRGMNPTVDEVITIDDDDSDVDELFIADLQRHGMFASKVLLESR